MKVLVGNSVYEEASVTIREGVLYVEFDAEDLDDVAVNLSESGILSDDSIALPKAGEK